MNSSPVDTVCLHRQTHPPKIHILLDLTCACQALFLDKQRLPQSSDSMELCKLESPKPYVLLLFPCKAGLIHAYASLALPASWNCEPQPPLPRLLLLPSSTAHNSKGPTWIPLHSATCLACMKIRTVQTDCAPRCHTCMTPTHWGV